MTMFRRACLCICRQKGRSLTLWLVIFITVAGIAASDCVRKAADEAAQEIGSSLNASFRLRGELLCADGGVPATKPLSDSEVAEILKDPDIRAWNATQIGTAAGDSIFYPSGRSEGPFLGVSSTAAYADFRNGRLALVHGRHLTDSDQFQALISQDLADENSLIPGSEISFGDSIVRVAGIYALGEDSDFDPDTIFADHSTFAGATGASPGEYSGWIEFFVSDPKHLDQSAQAARNRMRLLERDVALQILPGQHEALISLLSQTERLAAAICVTSAVAGGGLLFLTLSLRMRTRIYEIGLLLTLGVPRWSILGQMELEAMFLLLGAQFAAWPAVLMAITLANGVLPASASISISASDIFSQYAAELAIILLAVATVCLPCLTRRPRQILAQAE